MGFCEVLRLFLVFRCAPLAAEPDTLANSPQPILVFEITCYFDCLPSEFQRARNRAISAANWGAFFYRKSKTPSLRICREFELPFRGVCLLLNPVFVKILESLMLGLLICLFYVHASGSSYVYIQH
jgi:hypothetical protein